jgi:hypothetical protein
MTSEFKEPLSRKQAVRHASRPVAAGAMPSSLYLLGQIRPARYPDAIKTRCHVASTIRGTGMPLIDCHETQSIICLSVRCDALSKNTLTVRARRNVGHLGWRGIASTLVAWMAVLCFASVSVAQSPVTGRSAPAPVMTGLSDQGNQVSQIAASNGDRNFLMVDKNLGRVILFDGGKPVFSASALTGQYKVDRLPPDSLQKTFDQWGEPQDKVTPAGRFTVNRDFDPEYGELLEINEIKGVDWAIALHRVYLATPSERRAERLDSPDHSDNHITHGCINVSDKTMRFLLRKLPRTKPAAVLYVLPHDVSQTADYFPTRK